MQRPFPNERKRPFGYTVACNGYVTAVAVGQSQRFYSGVGIFNWYYLSSPPQIPRPIGADLELGGLTYFYNHAHRLRLEKLLYLELSRSSNKFLKALLDPGGGFTSETTARRFPK